VIPVEDPLLVPKKHILAGLEKI